MRKGLLIFTLLFFCVIPAAGFSDCNDNSADQKAVSYTVTFDGAGGTFVSGKLSQTVGSGETAKAPVFTKAGLTLTWDKALNNITNDTVITAVWKAKVEFVTNGGSEIESYLVTAGSAIVAPECIKNGYTIENWFTSINGGISGETWLFHSNVVNANVVLYAKWRDDRLTVIINTNSEIVISPIKVIKGEKITVLRITDRIDYDFAGWYSDYAFTKPFDIEKNVVVDDMTLYAKWVRTDGLTDQEYEIQQTLNNMLRELEESINSDFLLSGDKKDALLELLEGLELELKDITDINEIKAALDKLRSDMQSLLEELNQ